MSGPYESAFAVGAPVRIISAEDLARFRRTWTFHHPLTDEQLAAAGAKAIVSEVGFYHGGDPLYVLEGIPGFWHEPCLVRRDQESDVRPEK